MKKNAHHYISKFYLNGFAEKDSDRRTPSLWLYDIENPIPRSVSTNKIAKIKGFYSLFQNDSVDNDLEETFSRFESDVAPIFMRLKKEDLSFKDISIRYVLARFICFLAFRTPQFYKHINILFQNNMKTKFMDHWRDKGGTTILLKDLKDKLGEEATFENFIDSFNKMKIRLNPNSLQLMLIESAMRMIPVFGTMNWHFLRPDCDSYFITSDAPVVMINPDDDNPAIKYGYLHHNIWIVFPVNKSLCLVAVKTGREGFYLVNQDVVFMMNDHIAKAAKRFVFSPVRYDFTIEGTTNNAAQHTGKRTKGQIAMEM